MGYDSTTLPKKFRDKMVKHSDPIRTLGEWPNFAAMEPIAPIQESMGFSNTRPAYKLILPWPPSNNHYVGSRVVVPRNPATKPFVHRYLTTEAKEFKEKAAVIARDADMPLLKGYVLVVLNVYFPTKAGDLQNREKVLLDVLQGIAYVDDKQITRLECERFDDPANPRVEVTIQERV